MTTESSLRFEGFALDLHRLCLDGPSGRVDLRRKSFDVLLYLVEHAGRVVSKEELMSAIWPDVTVSDESLTQCISDVRRALGDTDRRIVKTVARRGYLVDVPISTASSATPTERPNSGEPLPPRVAVEPARRQVTAMACGFGAAAVAGRVDPEDLGEILAECHMRTEAAVTAHGGFLVKSLTDGLQFLFGYPQAREDDAERAVHAALAVTRAIGELKFEHLPQPLQPHVGIATGIVMITEAMDAGIDSFVVGEAPLLASALLGLVEPGGVMISDSTRRLIGGLFACRDRGVVNIDHSGHQLRVSEVLRESAIGSRFEALRSNICELVGRGEELDLLLRRWEQAKSDDGRVVLLTGEAGIGKSRLARALQERVKRDRHTPLVFHCSPQHQDSAFYPMIGELLHAAGIDGDDNAEAKLDKLEALLGRSSRNASADMPLLASLLSIPGGFRFPLPALTPQQLKAQTLRVLLGQIESLAAESPVLMLFEDLHWIDPTSLELLSLLVDRTPRLKLLLVATFRPEFDAPWANHRHISVVSLNRLSRPEGAALVAGVTKGKALPGDVVDQITARSDGVPLFIEELTKTMLESGLLQEADNRYELKGPLPSVSVPATLHASLLERFDRLGSVKDLAQIGAACGREFSYKLIAAASALPDSDLRPGISRLVDAELLFQRGVAPDATYVFKHALVQDAAYATLPRVRRQELHRRIAHVLEEYFSDIVATEPEVVAHHLTEAGLVERAVDYWCRAGARCADRSAYIEAVKHLSRAIEMLGLLPQTPDTLRKELEVLITLGPLVMAVKTVRSTDAEKLYVRARELVDQFGKVSQRFPVLWGLWFVNYSRGRYARASEVGERLLDAAQRGDDSGQNLEAHHALWATHSAMGHTADAMAHIKHGIALYDRKRHGSHTSLYGGHDAEVCNRYHLAVNLWLLGYPDQSLGAITDALRGAETLKHPMTSIIALWYAAWVYYQRGDRPTMTAHLEHLLALAKDHGIVAMTDVAGFLLNVDEQRPRQELAGLHDRLEARGANWQRVFCQCALADLDRKTGRTEEGLAVLASIPPQDRGVIYAPEILRLEGELRRCLPAPQTDNAERHFRAALTLARERGEKSLELRAAASLAGLWRDHGNRTEAIQLLKPIYDWFSEGLDLPDLRSSHALLCELENSV